MMQASGKISDQVFGWRQEWVQDGYTHFDIEHFQDLRLD
jgi:hypothetical protein